MNLKILLIATCVVVFLLVVGFLWLSSAANDQSPKNDPTTPAASPVVTSPVVNAPAIPPFGLREGQAIRCTARPHIYKYEAGKKRHYVSWEVYVKHGKPTPKTLTCAQVESIPEGEKITT